VRPATPDDLPPCAELLNLLFSHEREFTPDPAVHEKRLEMIMNDPEKGSVFV
jgi:hypothetical protein